MKKVFNLRLLLIGFILLFLNGCSLVDISSKKPLKIQRYEIKSTQKESQQPFESNGPSLLVYPIQSNARFGTTRIAYTIAPHEIAYYAKSEWADTPGNMLLPLIVNSLENTNKFRAILVGTSPVVANYAIDSNILDLMHYHEKDISKVRIVLRIQLLDLRNRDVIATKVFSIEKMAPSNDAYGAVVATNQGIETLLKNIKQFVQDSLSRP